ncbi:MAG: M56 family metallopeptidase [Chloroflexaceae bacterium]|nr:M56 family metallopeptidase [Chloroflexaceae bacterium]
MHVIVITIAIALSGLIRLLPLKRAGAWGDRWRQALLLFLLPPLLLLATLVAVLCMGPQGQMFGLPASAWSYWFAWGAIALAGMQLIRLAWQGWQTQQQLRGCPLASLRGQTVRVLDLDLLYSAQIGFWEPELAISRGLLQRLEGRHLEAVLAHEMAHRFYRDTFWFFGLGWLRSLLFWLPNTEVLWQELLLLRELRADWQAAQRVDPLVLAESLLVVAAQDQSRSLLPEVACMAALDPCPGRLAERVEALLSPPDAPPCLSRWLWLGLALAFVPLVVIPWHN